MSNDIGTVLDSAASAGAPESTETPVGQTPQESQPEPQEQTPQGEQPQPEAPEQQPSEKEPEAEPDGRKVEASVRNALAKIKATDANAEKQLRKDHYLSRDITQLLPDDTSGTTLQKVKNLVATVETLGGAEGIEELQSKVSDYDREIDQFSQGDPALLQELHAANPESFVTMTGNALRLLSESNPKGFEQATLPALAQVMESSGMNNAIIRTLDYVKAGKGQEAYDLLQEVAGWLHSKKTAAAELAKVKQSDPERQKLDEEKKTIASDKQEIFNQRMGQVFGPKNSTELGKLVTPFAKEIGLAGDGLREFNNAVYSKVFAKMKADTQFQKLAQAKIAKGDHQAAAEFIASKFADLVGDVFIAHRNLMYPNYAQMKKNAPPKPGAPPPKPVQGKVYSRAEVDIDNTPDVHIVTGKAYLKGSKTLVPYKSSW